MFNSGSLSDWSISVKEERSPITSSWQHIFLQAERYLKLSRLCVLLPVKPNHEQIAGVCAAVLNSSRTKEAVMETSFEEAASTCVRMCTSPSS